MKVVIKSISCLVLTVLVVSCSTEKVVVTDSPTLPNTTSPAAQTTQKEEKASTRSSETPVLTPGTAQRTISSTKIESMK